MISHASTDTEDGPEMINIYPKNAVESAIFEHGYTGHILKLTSSFLRERNGKR